MDTGANGVCVIREVNGRLDIATATDVGEELRRGISADPTRLVVRMGSVSFLDSSGLGMLVGLQKELTDGGGRLVLCEVPPQARMALRLTRLEWLLPSFETLREAMAA